MPRMIAILKIAALCVAVAAALNSAAAQGYSISWYYNNPGASTFDIETREDLAGLAVLVNNNGVNFSGKTVQLRAVIDLENKEWMPIGTAERPFTGKFNGFGLEVRNVYINDPNLDYAGLFGHVSDSIYDLGVANAEIAARNYVGGVVGYVNGGNIINSYSSGDKNIRGDNYVGGVVGYTHSTGLHNGNVISCRSTNDVIGTNENVGGVVGYAGGRVEKTFSITGKIIGEKNVGGVAGHAARNVLNCFSTNTVNGSTSVGGLVGAAYGNVTTCYSTGNVEGADYVGGLVGMPTGVTKITNSAALSKEVKGVSLVGLIGGGYADKKEDNNAIYKSLDLIINDVSQTTHDHTVLDSVTAETLFDDIGTVGKRFKSPIWKTDCSNLPGTFEPIDAPEYLSDDQFQCGIIIIHVKPGQEKVLDSPDPQRYEYDTIVYRRKWLDSPNDTLYSSMASPGDTVYGKEKIELAGYLTRVTGENVGDYLIINSPEPLRARYSSSYEIYFEEENNNDPRVTFKITPRTIKVSADAGQSKVEGEPDPVFRYTSDAPTNVTFSGALSRVEAGNQVPGRYAILVGSLSPSNDNYVVKFETADFTVKKIVTVTATPGQGKIFGDPDPEPPLAYTSSEAGVDFTGELERAAGDTVDAYPINKGSLAVVNAAGFDYELIFVGDVFTIRPKPITVTVDIGQGKVYGDPDPDTPLAYTSSEAGVVFTGELKRAAGDTVGAYPITQNTLSAGNNYDITFEGANFLITPKPITVTVIPGQGKVFGEDDPDTLAYTYYPLDTVFFEGALERDIGEVVGTYAIKQGSLKPVSGNFELVFTDGEVFTITKKVIVITITAGQEKVYGDPEPDTLKYTSDAPSGVMISGALVRDTGSAVGAYPIRQGSLIINNNDDYELSFTVGAVFTITKKPVTVIVIPGQGKKVYTADPEFFYKIEPALVEGDTMSGKLDRAPGEELGEYRINQGTLSAGDNYDMQFIDAVFVISEKTPIFVTAVNVAPKIFDGYTTAEILEVTLQGAAGLVRDVDYAVDSAYFDDPNAGDGRRVTVKMTLLETPATADYVFLKDTCSFVGYRIDKRAGAPVETPAVKDNGYFTVSVYPVKIIDPPPFNDQTAEYAVSKDPAASPNSLIWQDSAQFGREADGGAWYVYARSKENLNHLAGPVSRSAGIVKEAFVPVADIIGLPDTVLLKTPLDLRIAAITNDDATYKEIVWTVSATRSTGAAIAGTVLNTETAGIGPVKVTATVKGGAGWDYELNEPLDFVRTFEIHVARPDMAVITGNYAQGWIKVGPNPARRNSREIKLYRTGRLIGRSTLAVYDKLGNVVRTIVVRDDALMGEDVTRLIGTWDLTDERGRRMGYGTYLLRGKVRYTDGGTEPVSILFGIGE